MKANVNICVMGSSDKTKRVDHQRNPRSQNDDPLYRIKNNLVDPLDGQKGEIDSKLPQRSLAQLSL